MEDYELLEVELEQFCGLPGHSGTMVACCNGTAALHLALESLGLPKGSQVIVPEFTMIAAARAVVMAGMRPVFVDCDDRLCIDVDKIEDAITSLTSAIIPTHIYGRCCNMERIREIADEHGLAVIEDCAESHGARASEFWTSDAYVWSFYKNKIIAGEEGGAILFRDPESADRARCLRSHGFTPEHDFTHVPNGFNYRLSNGNARLIRKSLADYEDNVSRRRVIEAAYGRWIDRDFVMPQRDAVWVYDICVPSQSHVVWELNKAGIQARSAFKPMSAQDEFRGNFRHLKAWDMYQKVMYLPVGDCPGLNAVRKACEIINSVA